MERNPYISDNNWAHNIDYYPSAPPDETDDYALSPPPYVADDYPPPPPPYDADDYAPPPPPYVTDAYVSPPPSLQVNGEIQSGYLAAYEEHGNQQYLIPLHINPETVEPFPYQLITGTGTNTQTQTHVIITDAENTGAKFSDNIIRRRFVRNVYSIVFVQLLFTLGVVALFVFEKHVKKYVQEHIFFYLASYLTLLVASIMMVPRSNVRRQFPGNVFCLVIFSLGMTYVAAAVSSFHNTNTVLIGTGICAGTSLGITLFSICAKFDFKGCCPYFFVFFWVLSFFGIASIFTYREIMLTIYSGLGALLMMWLLTYNTQMIMRGKRHKLCPEEYVASALQLYLDIIYIFLYLITIIFLYLCSN